MVEIGPGGVQGVRLRGSAEEQDRALAKWPLLRRELVRLNRLLEREALEGLLRENPPLPPAGDAA